MGVLVLGPDINESFYKFAVNKKGEIRFGLGAVKGLGESAVEAIVNERKENGFFKSFDDFAKWISLSALFNSIKFVSSKKFFSKWSLIEIEDFFIVFIILLKNLLSIPLFFKLDVRG